MQDLKMYSERVFLHYESVADDTQTVSVRREPWIAFIAALRRSCVSRTMKPRPHHLFADALLPLEHSHHLRRATLLAEQVRHDPHRPIDVLEETLVAGA